jgi:hypothetical protein
MTPLMADQPSGISGRTGRSSVKARLTPNGRRQPVENDEYASFMRRVVRAYARRVAAGDADWLCGLDSRRPLQPEIAGQPSPRYSSGYP